MPDIIQLLSDHIANQIAAGEVIQRPASAVKELLENAVDAGATEIQLIIKDAGKEAIQVIDNGKGMSPTDARMSFERHATSKIKNIDDLFAIRTMGFRGEALASIAAVSQVELKTRQPENEVGTRLLIEGTEVKLQEACAANAGTNILVKNLFFNVPARRHFLKSANVEFRHILDEFSRVALSQPDIKFRFWSNNAEQFHLDAGNLKTRIVALLGNQHEKNLVPVEEKTDLLNIYGFVGKPEAATRTRGMQYFFINNRFVRSPYLNHAVAQAYDSMIEKEAFPFYVLFLEIDPSRVDVNVHPTKQEVKFEDDRMIYSYLNAAIRHSLARYNIAPSLDFSLNPEIQQMRALQLPTTEQQKEETEKGYLYNTFSEKNQAHFIERSDNLKRWKDLYQIAVQFPAKTGETLQNTAAQPTLHNDETVSAIAQKILQVHKEFLVTTVKSGMMLIHIQRAQERIWFERLSNKSENGGTASQKLLYPITYELPPQDAALLNEALPDLVNAGFDIASFGQHDFVVQGIPSGLAAGEEKDILDELLEQLKHGASAADSRPEILLNHLARRLSQNKQALMQPEMQQALIDELFGCTQPEYTPGGKKVFTILKLEDIEKMIG